MGEFVVSVHQPLQPIYHLYRNITSISHQNPDNGQNQNDRTNQISLELTHSNIHRKHYIRVSQCSVKADECWSFCETFCTFCVFGGICMARITARLSISHPHRINHAQSHHQTMPHTFTLLTTRERFTTQLQYLDISLSF